MEFLLARLADVLPRGRKESEVASCQLGSLRILKPPEQFDDVIAVSAVGQMAKGTGRAAVGRPVAQPTRLRCLLDATPAKPSRLQRSPAFFSPIRSPSLYAVADPA